MKGLFISGSGTNVGKTFVASQLVKILSETRLVSVRKPVESDCERSNAQLVTKDAVLLSKASNVKESIDTVCRYQFEACASAEIASKEIGVELGLSHLLQACDADEFVVIEGAGGLLSPMATQVLNADLMAALKLPVVLVVKDELGAVNQALLSINSAKNYQLDVCMLVLNQISPNTLNNAQAISQYTNVKVVVFNTDKPEDFNHQVREILV